MVNILPPSKWSSRSRFVSLAVIGLLLWWVVTALGSLTGFGQTITPLEAGRYLKQYRIYLPFGYRLAYLELVDFNSRLKARRLMTNQLYEMKTLTPGGEIFMTRPDGAGDRCLILDGETLATTGGGSTKFHVRDARFSRKWLLLVGSTQVELYDNSSGSEEPVATLPVAADQRVQYSSALVLTDKLYRYDQGKFEHVPSPLDPLAEPTQTDANSPPMVECLSIDGQSLLLRETVNGQEPKYRILSPIQDRSKEVDLKDISDAMLLSSGTRILTWKNTESGSETKLLTNDLKELASFAGGSFKWEKERTRVRDSITRPVPASASTISFLNAADGEPVAKIDMSPSGSSPWIWLARVLALIWCTLWIRQTGLPHATLLSTGGLMAMGAALVQAFLTTDSDWSLSILASVQLVVGVYAIGWLFASDWPLQRRIPCILLFSVLAMQPWTGGNFQESSLLYLFIICTVVVAIRQSRSSAKSSNQFSFSILDIMLWTGLVAVFWQAGTSIWRLPNVVLLVLNACLIVGVLLLVYRPGKWRAIGGVLVIVSAVSGALAIPSGLTDEFSVESILVRLHFASVGGVLAACLVELALRKINQQTYSAAPSDTSTSHSSTSIIA